jgi:16S rRNA (uracil1498-N3)-methyltransferase
MRMLTPRFHCPQATPGLARGTRVELPDDAAHHALRVLRLREGHPVSVFCGHGGEYEAVLEAARGKSAQVLLGTFHAADRAPRVDVHVQQSVVATEKMDWVVEKAVSSGIPPVQRALANSQRGANAQPGIVFETSGGRPGMV